MSHRRPCRNNRGFLRRLGGPLLAFALAATVAACAKTIDQRGNLPDPIALERLTPGKATRADVIQTLGSPSSVGTFDDEVWYYIAARTERFAFFAPKVIDQEVVAIAFDDKGRVRAIDRYTLKDARKIEPVDRVTPTGGRKLTILQQLVGNLGRFVGKKDSASAP